MRIYFCRMKFDHWWETMTSYISSPCFPIEEGNQKKGNPDLISNLWKTKRRITKLITENDSTTIPLSYDTLITQANRWLLSNHFCKACQNCLHPSFVIVHKAVRMHLLLLCYESSRKCYHAAQTTPTWTKPILHVLQIWLLCSHPWPNMNELCAKLKLTNYAIMRWNQFCYICFQFWEILSQARVFFYATQSS